MGVNIGIVIGCDNVAYMNCAKVRIPSIHGIPLTESIYDKMLKDFSGYINENSSSIGNHKRTTNITKYKLNQINSTDNSKVVSDDDIPWYPICFPFGSTKGPRLFDLVYVLDESYVIGWTGRVFTPSDVDED